MQRLLTLALAAAAALATLPAHASLIFAEFSGAVASQKDSGFAVNAPVSGEFIYDTSSATYLSFTIAGQSAPAGFASSAQIVSSLTDAIYQAQISPVTTPGATNNTFSLDLSSLTTWPSTDTAVTLLTDTNQLTTNLDTNPLSMFPSTFGYYIGDSAASDYTFLIANLTSFNATVPEPGSLALSLAGLALMGLRARAQTGRDS